MEKENSGGARRGTGPLAENYAQCRRYFVDLDDFAPPDLAGLSLSHYPASPTEGIFLRSSCAPPAQDADPAGPARLSDRRHELPTDSGMWIVSVTPNTEHLIGQGRFSRVFRGTVRRADAPPNTAADAAVAVKFCNRDSESTLAGQAESEMLRRLACLPGATRLYDTISGPPPRLPLDSSLAIVTEYAEGGPLSGAIFSHSPPPAQLLQWAVELFTALADMHELGVVHLDIKPHNMLLVDGRVKLADFGCSARTPLTVAATQSKGTLVYTAPELLSVSAVEVRDGACDVYGAGVALYCMATGREPFAAFSRQSGVSLVIAIRQGFLAGHHNVWDARHRWGDLGGDAVRVLVARCVERRPECRPTAREAAALLLGLQRR